MRKSPATVQKVGIVGAGVIGGGWALHFLRLGKEVRVWDPDPEAGKRLMRQAEQTWPILEKIGLAWGASLDNLILAPELEALSAVQVIQENAPENLDSKQSLFEAFDAAIPEEVPVLSSTSGFSMTEIQARCRTAARTCVGHPFNPPYLMPFVEVVGGKATDPGVVDWAFKFYSEHEKKPIRMKREVPGFIANRLQEALWREALHMVANDEATPEEIDASIKHGPGLRWAIMGPCMTFHLAGGRGGIAHMLDHFGPALEEPWTRLQAPKLTEELRSRMIQGCREMSNGKDIPEYIRERDECLIRIMQALYDYQNREGESDATPDT